MQITENGFKYDDKAIKGLCPDDGGHLVDAPNAIGSVKVSDEDLQAFEAGIWGIAFCPKGVHYRPWVLPEYRDRVNASEDNPFGELFRETIDKLPDEL